MVGSSSPRGDSIYESLQLETAQVERLHAGPHGFSHPVGDLLHHLRRGACICGAGDYSAALQVLLQVLHLQ